MTVCYDPIVEIKQKKEKKQKEKHPQEKSTLQRSKTFVNSLFKGGRKRDTSKGRSKSPSKAGKGRCIFASLKCIKVAIIPLPPNYFIVLLVILSWTAKRYLWSSSQHWFSPVMFSGGRQVSAMPNSEMLVIVEDMARRLLTEEEVAAVMKTCRRVRSFAADKLRRCCF